MANLNLNRFCNVVLPELDGRIDLLIPVFAISATAQAVTEGNAGTVTASFAVSRAGALTRMDKVNYAVSASGANPADAADFAGGVFPSGSIVFDLGETTKTIAIAIQGDTSLEPTEGYAVTITLPGVGVLGNSVAQGTIANDDVAAPTGPKTTFPTKSGNTILWEMDPDKVPQSNNTRVTSHTDPVSGLTSTAPGTGPMYIVNSANGHAGFRFSNNDAERLVLGKPAAVVNVTSVNAGWAMVVVLKNTTTDGNNAAFGDNYSNGLFLTPSWGYAPFSTTGETVSGIHTYVYSGNPVGMGDAVRYRDGVQLYGAAGVRLGAGANVIMIGSGRNDGDQNGSFPYDGDILYIALVQGDYTPAEALQIHLWACNKWGKASPLAGRTYFPVFDGDSITAGTGAEWFQTYPTQIAAARGWKAGQWANVGKPGASVTGIGGDGGNNMMTRGVRDCDGFADVTGLPVVLIAGEWYNQGTGGGTTGQGVSAADNLRTYAATRKATGKFQKLIGWTSTSSQREGTARDGFNASLMSNPGAFDAMTPMHTDSKVGVNGQYLVTTPVQYIGDQIHPTAAGYTAMRDVMNAALTAAGYTT